MDKEESDIGLQTQLTNSDIKEANSIINCDNNQEDTVESGNIDYTENDAFSECTEKDLPVASTSKKAPVELADKDVPITLEDVEDTEEPKCDDISFAHYRQLRSRPSSSIASRGRSRTSSAWSNIHGPKDDTMFHEKPAASFITAQTILHQPEMHFLRQEMESKPEEDKFSRARINSSSSLFSEEELALVRRFPWLAERLKLAWAEVKEAEQETAKKSSLKQRKTGSILKQRSQEEQTSLKPPLEDDEETKSRPKVVFSRNIPLFIYSSEAKKAIRIGGDTSNRMTEEVYKALEYNPELKKITLDLQDLCRPDRDRTIRLAVSYLSATTNHNPLVISEHMARYSGKKEAAIKHLVNEIESRLLSRREVRLRRDKQWKLQLEDIIRAKLEAEARENDIMVAKRQLEDSKKEDLSIMTVTERTQERGRRIKLRTKSIPLSERVPPKKKERRMGVHNISLIPPDLTPILSGPVHA